MTKKYPKIAQLKDIDAFRNRLRELEIELPADDKILTGDQSPLSSPIQFGKNRVGNRWCIHPMEGWDANPDGSPTEFTRRRWRNFGKSGAKLIWGGEAAAVQPEGRANPNQTLATPENREGLQLLLNELTAAHQTDVGSVDDLVVGLQLTHSGRFCRPNDKRLEPRIPYHHPLLDEKFRIDPNDDSIVWTDDQIYQLIDSYVQAAKLAADVGFQFVDVKACHGYLLHEFLSARVRGGPFGGDFDGRTNLLRTIISRIRSEVSHIDIGVRLSLFDFLPYQTSREIGQPMEFAENEPYIFGFGVKEDAPLEMDLREPLQLIGILEDLGVVSINVSCGSPYYNPHIQRPAIFPPSDGYLPPEDPLVGVARQIHATKECKQAFPNMVIVGTGYSYLQDYLPHVAQAVVRQSWADLIGLGRMVLSYPTLPMDTLKQGEMQRKLVCRTFSDCTTAPRNGIVSGCFPLDPYYKGLDAAEELKRIKSKNT